VTQLAGHTRLFTFQKTCVLDLFDGDGRYVPTWEGIGVAGNHRIAYQYVSDQMRKAGLTNAGTPPVWTFEASPEDLELLATALLSEHELAQSRYVTLELTVPESMVLRSDYAAWCDLYFDCLETGAVPDDPSWLNHSQTKTGGHETVQAILPYIQKTWVTSVEPLQVCPP
jgi:hypothetical protein